MPRRRWDQDELGPGGHQPLVVFSCRTLHQVLEELVLCEPWSGKHHALHNVEIDLAHNLVQVKVSGLAGQIQAGGW